MAKAVDDASSKTLCKDVKVPLPQVRAVGYLIATEAERAGARALNRHSPLLPRLESKDTLYLHDLAVHPEYQGQGVAQHFLDMVGQRRSELELDRIALIAVEGAHTYGAQSGFTEREGGMMG